MSDILTTGEIILPFPHKGQQAVRDGAKRFNWISAGRRWRKTTLLMTLAVETMIQGKRFFWGAPTFDQVRIGWNEMKVASNGNINFSLQRMTAELPRTGGMTIFRSLDDPDNARGHSADRAGFDETGDIKESAYYQVVRAMLIDTGGDFYGVGTPLGRNWFWRKHKGALDQEDSVSWQIPTKGCEIVDGRLVRKPHPHENPDIAWEEIERLYTTMPMDIFKQEILAEFIENEGAVFRNILACLNAPLDPDPKEHEGHTKILGLDWGKHNDFTAASLGCVDCMVELARDRFNQIDYIFQRGRLQVLCDKWQPDIILAESNAMGEPIIEQLQEDGLPVTGFATTASSKPPLIENLALVFEREEFQFQNDPIWTGELEVYERKVSVSTGRSQYGAPDGMHDDTVIARALMLRNITGGSWYIS